MEALGSIIPYLLLTQALFAQAGGRRDLAYRKYICRSCFHSNAENVRQKGARYKKFGRVFIIFGDLDRVIQTQNEQELNK